MLSASGQINDIDQAKCAGASEYMLKPFNPLMLLERVRYYLNVWDFDDHMPMVTAIRA